MPGYWLNVLGNAMRTKQDLELEARLRREAQERGVDYETVAREYIKKVVEEYRENARKKWVTRKMEEEDARFREAVQKGIEAADRGELIDHEEVERMMEGWLKGKP